MSETNEGFFSCKNICWIAGALLGFAAYLIMRGRWETSFILALIVGLALMIGIALVLRIVFCAEVEETAGGVAGRAAARADARVAAEADARAAKADASALADTQAADAKAAKEAADAKAAKEAAAAKAAKEAADAKAAKAAADAKAAKAAASTAKAAKSSSAKAAAPKSTRKPVAPDGKPELLSKAREGGPDDLKMIKGVGPKMEGMLHKLGVFHFDQVASWRKKEVEWVDEHLEGFKGRVSRDEWVKQAKVLAKGGQTEFAKKVKKGGVY